MLIIVIYESFIEQEKQFNKLFLIHLQIRENRFDDYSFLKPILNNTELILNIYKIIDDIIKIFQVDHKIRHLMLSDFLFSIMSSDLTDLNNLIFKINRNDYFHKIQIRAIINTIFNCNPNDYILMHKKFLIGLRINKILLKIIIRKKQDNNWETIVYFQFLNQSFILNYPFLLGFSNKPFILISLNKYKFLISSYRNVWEIKRKKREMENIELPFDSVIRASNVEYKLSSELLKINNECIQNEKMKLLKIVECNDIDDYLKKIVQIINNNKYSNKIFNTQKVYNEQMLNNKIKNIKKFETKPQEEYFKIMLNFQKIISFKILEQNIFDKKIYLPCFMDNRARQYYYTLISPTFYKLFRYLYKFNKKKKFVNLKKSFFYKEIIKYKYTINEYKLNNKNSYILIILFIEIGKYFLNDTNDYFFKTTNIIESGIKNYKLKNKILKFEDLLYVNKIYDLVDNLLKNNNIDINSIIFKDATASGLQNYGLIVGYQEDKLKYLNIDGQDRCDTYKYLIEKYLKTDIKFIMKRKYWKHTIMTIPYNATKFTCFSKLIDTLKEDNIIFYDLNKELQNKIKELHKNFYNDLKKNIKNEFYTNEKNKIKKFKYNKWTIVNIKEYKINYKNSRDKYTNILYMLNEDSITTKRAEEANNMHYNDAELVKHVLNKFEVMSIHDCFGIRLCELHEVMDHINYFYSNNIKKKTYCIHILI